MREQKKQIEILLMHYFKECYHDFPKGRVMPTESPDFTVRMKNQRELGIELTRLNPENSLLQNEIQIKQTEDRENLIAFTRELFEQKSPLKLFVKFLFSKTKPVVASKKLILAVQIAKLLQEAVGRKNPGAYFKASISGAKLPEELNEILILHHPVLEVSVWERSNNLGVSNDVLDDIKKAIIKKDEKLGIYQKQRLNSYWLLITTDRLRGVKSFNIPNKIMNHHFESGFQHVFLFDLVKSKIYELV